MRGLISLLFGVLATAAVLSLPFWAGFADFRDTVPAEELALAERYANDIRTHNFADANAITVPQYRQASRAIYGKMAGLFPPGAPARSRVTGWLKTIGNGGSTMQLEIFQEYDNRGAVRTQFLLSRDASLLQVLGAKFDYFKQDVLHANDFALPAPSQISRWIALLTAVLLDVFAFTTFALCIAGPAPRWRWRWLWLIFVLAGVMRYNFDWSSGEIAFLPVSFLLPPAGLYRFAAFGPWFVSLTVPLGAAAYWAYRARWRHEDDNAPGDMRS